jgi:iron only hydrogenase large subunit-like protein
MGTATFHHALQIDIEKCIGCTRCMKVCPTDAIRVVDGKSRIIADRCIDCGECFRACPYDAFYIEQDDFKQIYNYKYRIAIVPAVLIGQFPRNISTRRIYSAFLEEGFTHVYESEYGVDILIKALNEYQQIHTEIKPIISSFCPAIVRLIQVRFPSLVNNILLLKPPLDLTALSVKKQLINSGVAESEIGVFYVTPCAAKIAAIKSPVGEEKSIIDGVINMDFIYNKLLLSISKDEKSNLEMPSKDRLTGVAMQWTLTNGEASNAIGRSLAIDGIHNVIEFLEKLEDDSAGTFDFLELRACDESCAGGILAAGSRFLTAERLHNRAEKFNQNYDKSEVEKIVMAERLEKYVIAHIGINKIEPRFSMALDEDTEAAIQKMEKIRSLMSLLPHIDCGGCGAPNCRSLAEDIVQQKAVLSSCVFLQKQMQKDGKMDAAQALDVAEKIWGKDRFKKDVLKKG